MSVKIIYSKTGKFYSYGQEASIQLEGDWSKLISGKFFFYENLVFKKWDKDLSALKNGKCMFYRSGITSFEGDLSSLVDGSDMFCWTDLLSFSTTNLLKLEIGDHMFWLKQYPSGSMTSFTYNLPVLTTAKYMFSDCIDLTTFESSLVSLSSAYCMFQGCESLTTFKSNLKSLISATSMFSSCKLNVASVKNIADTIKNINGISLTAADGKITIDIDDTLSNSNKNTILSHFTTIEGKGWTVDSNLSTTAALSEEGEPIDDTSVYVKLEEANDHHCTHTDKDGNKVILRSAKYVGGPKQHEWTLFASLEGAEQFFGLTRIVDELNNNT